MWLLPYILYNVYINIHMYSEYKVHSIICHTYNKPKQHNLCII